MFDWDQRATQFDAQWEAYKNRQYQEVMDYGLALDFERVRKLKMLAEFLDDQMFEVDEDGNLHNIWLPDVKQIGSGDDAMRVDLVRFNAGIIREYRGVLDDIAKETGGRAQKHQLSGADGKPLSFFDEVVSTLKSIDGGLHNG